MKVVIAPARYRPSLGGVETHAREVAVRLAREFEITVVTSNPGRHLVENEVIDGVAVRRVPTWPSSGDPFIPIGWSRTLREIAPDVVIIDGYQSVVSARALMYVARRGIPSVLVFHEGANPNRIRQALYPLQRKVLGRWIRQINKTIATAPHEIDQYQSELRIRPDSLEYIPNGSDLPTPPSPPKVDEFKIVSIGRLESQKRHHLVIDALAELRHDGNPWSLVIVGQGDEREALEVQARERGLDGYVTVTSFDGDRREEMSSELMSARIVIAPSLYETHPMAVVEAALLGCHVLVPEEGNKGVTDLATRGMVESIPSSSAHEIAESIRDARLRSFETNRSELTTWDDCAEEFKKIVRKLANDVRALGATPQH